MVVVGAAVVGRYCLSIDGRFSLSVAVAGRVLDETIFDGNVDCVLEVSVTPLLFAFEPAGSSETSDYKEMIRIPEHVKEFFCFLHPLFED